MRSVCLLLTLLVLPGAVAPVIAQYPEPKATPPFPTSQNSSTTKSSDGGGSAVGLIVVIVVIAIIAALFARVRCKRCGYRDYKSKFVGGRCPQCQSLEYE